MHSLRFAGKLFDAKGVRFTPTHSVKNGKRYRYYTSQAAVQRASDLPPITRFPAHQLEQLVLAQIVELLRKPEKWQTGIPNSPETSAAAERARDFAKTWLTLLAEKQHSFVREIMRRVIVGNGTVWIEVDRMNLLAALLQDPDYHPDSGEIIAPLSLVAKFNCMRRGNELRVLLPHRVDTVGSAPISSLVNLVARARDWYDQVAAGKARSISQLATQAGLGLRHTRRILQCATLSPEIVEALLSGRHRPDLTVNQILKTVPLGWQEQKRQILRIG
ncbi:MAG: hypothetical protein WCD49_13985 [Candidatus Acidiferrales bacterium]